MHVGRGGGGRNIPPETNTKAQDREVEDMRCLTSIFLVDAGVDTGSLTASDKPQRKCWVLVNGYILNLHKKIVLFPVVSSLRI